MAETQRHVWSDAGLSTSFRVSGWMRGEGADRDAAAWMISTSSVDDPLFCMHHSGTQSKLHARWGSERSNLNTPTTYFVRCFVHCSCLLEYYAHHRPACRTSSNIYFKRPTLITAAQLAPR